MNPMLVGFVAENILQFEMMEEQFDIHFLEQWKYADERRHSQFIERMELDKIRSRMFL